MGHIPAGRGSWQGESQDRLRQDLLPHALRLEIDIQLHSVTGPTVLDRMGLPNVLSWWWRGRGAVRGKNIAHRRHLGGRVGTQVIVVLCLPSLGSRVRKNDD